MASGKPSIILEPLRSSDFLSTLKLFLEMLRTCVGPQASLKILISGGGLTTITSSSSRLLENVILTNPICVMVSQVMKAQLESYRDYGLYTGILASSLLDHVLKQQLGMLHATASHLIQQLNSQLTSFLKLPSIKLYLDFTTVNQLLPVAHTVLSSKPACGLTRAEVRALSVKVVKAFLNSIGTQFGEVVVCAGKCDENFFLFQGVLYQTDIEGQVLNVLNNRISEKCEIPLILFNIMLTNKNLSKSDQNTSSGISLVSEGNSDIVKQALLLLEQAVKFNVGIVACQKVVHTSIHLFLQRIGILLLDRMGTELTRAVEKLSGALPISSLTHISSEDLKSYLGCIDSLKQVTCGNKQYILLERKNANVSTLLLHAPSEEAFLELKLVTEQTLAALRQLVHQPVVVPGAGCLEVWLAAMLQSQNQDLNQLKCSSSYLKAGISWIQRSLLAAAGFPLTVNSSLAVDSVYLHGWQQHADSYGSVCCCGLVTATSVKLAGGKWVEPSNFGVHGTLFPNLCTTPTILDPHQVLNENVFVDVYSSKCNAIKLALESSVHILSIGLIVYKPPV